MSESACVESSSFLAPTGAFIVTMCYYVSIRPLSQIFTRSIDAIDVTSVTLSCFNSINAIDVTRERRMFIGPLVECQMSFLLERTSGVPPVILIQVSSPGD